jgi:lipopolysaccharide transport system ATP-binding protein
MSDVAIRVDNLSKRYRIGLKEEVHDTFAGAAFSILRSPFKNVNRLRRLSTFSDNHTDDIIWALKDVSFEVKQGEVVGVIGRNGAGKSTLLKILSRITHPTSGRVELHGRVSSLLEVGTGFHPELTGRENVYLNGTVLGMTKAEIDRKFDEIVDFSGVEKFIDTPVKRYSSGMQVRLAFSVAAHLEPEILLVDEVLAVGDAAFQQKCLGKMDDIAQGGRTILFVSHQMGMIVNLCPTAMLIQDGSLLDKGFSQKVVDNYINANSYSRAETSFKIDKNRSVQFTKTLSLGKDKEVKTNYSHKEKIHVNIEFVIRDIVHDLTLGIIVYDNKNRKVFTSQIVLPQLSKLDMPEKSFSSTVEIPEEVLVPGNYKITIVLHVPLMHVYDIVEEALFFTIYDGGSQFAQYQNIDYGVVFVNCKWSL